VNDYRVQPVKASLVADLVELININLAELLTAALVQCPECRGMGETGGGEPGEKASTCSTCSGVGYIERYSIDMERLKSYRYGRLVEGFEVKQGQLVPKMRSKDKAFSVLVKLLGLEKAVIEIAAGASFAEALSQEQRAVYVEQLKELAVMGALDG
jgi:hypothetical protein